MVRGFDMKIYLKLIDINIRPLIIGIAELNSDTPDSVRVYKGAGHFRMT